MKNEFISSGKLQFHQGHCNSKCEIISAGRLQIQVRNQFNKVVTPSLIDKLVHQEVATQKTELDSAGRLQLQVRN